MAPPLQYWCLENSMDGGAWKAAVHGVTEGLTRQSYFTFHFQVLEKEMANHSSVLSWRIPGMGEAGGLPSMGSHRVGHNWSDVAAAAAAVIENAREFQKKYLFLLVWLCQSLWLCGSQKTMENSERDGNTRPPDLTPKKLVCRPRSNSYSWRWNSILFPNRKRSMSRMYIVTLLI